MEPLDIALTSSYIRFFSLLLSIRKTVCGKNLNAEFSAFIILPYSFFSRFSSPHSASSSPNNEVNASDSSSSASKSSKLLVSLLDNSDCSSISRDSASFLSSSNRSNSSLLSGVPSRSDFHSINAFFIISQRVSQLYVESFHLFIHLGVEILIPDISSFILNPFNMFFFSGSFMSARQNKTSFSS